MNNQIANKEKKRLILVEDDLELSQLISEFLAKHEFIVSTVNNGIEAADKIIEEQPDIVILDVMLPGQNGMEVCKQVRHSYQGPILMQTALDEDIDQMMGLELGADDYIIKQIQPRLLLSRVRALLRRSNHPSKVPDIGNTSIDNFVLTVGSLTIDLSNRTVLCNDKVIILTTAEFELLRLLANSPGEVVTREDIILNIRGYEYDGLDRSIDRRISRLRKKLSDDPANPSLIKTVRGLGYQLCL